MSGRFEENIDEGGKLLAEALRTVTNKQFRQLADLMPTKVWLCNPQGKIIFVNRDWISYTGISEEEAMDSWFDTKHPDEKLDFRSQFENCILTLTPFEREVRLRAADGTFRWHICRALPYRNESGETEYWIGTSTDIEENKQLLCRLEEMNSILEDKVQERTTMLHEAEKLAHLGSWEWNLDDNSLFWSDELCEIFGVDPNQKPTSLKEYQSLLFPQTRDELEEKVKKAIQEKSGYRVEHRIKRKDGRYKVLDSRGKIICDAFGKPVKITGTTLDITELKEAESLLKEKNEELVRTNNELEQFAYIASHDLKEPLRMVSTYTQLLKSKFKEKLSDEGLEYINFAVEGATRMQALINDLLTYSRVGRVHISMEPVDINDLLKSVTLNLEQAIKESHPKIHYENLPTIRGMHSALGQLFQNLIQNAIKFRREEDPEIYITAQRQGKYWHFKCKDNGIGIPKEYHERIFMLFQRLHTREQYEGTGIGLSICRKVVELHGGKIWAESEPDKGSTFNFTLPAY